MTEVTRTYRVSASCRCRWCRRWCPVTLEATHWRHRTGCAHSEPGTAVDSVWPSARSGAAPAVITASWPTRQAIVKQQLVNSTCISLKVTQLVSQQLVHYHHKLAYILTLLGNPRVTPRNFSGRYFKCIGKLYSPFIFWFWQDAVSVYYLFN